MWAMKIRSALGINFSSILHITVINAPISTFLITLVNALSIYSGLYKWKTRDDNQKKFILPLAIDNKFFIAYLPILVRCKTKGYYY